MYELSTTTRNGQRLGRYTSNQSIGIGNAQKEDNYTRQETRQ